VWLRCENSSVKKADAAACQIDSVKFYSVDFTR
jgi:hypothetical protein